MGDGRIGVGIKELSAEQKKLFISMKKRLQADQTVAAAIKAEGITQSKWQYLRRRVEGINSPRKKAATVSAQKKKVAVAYQAIPTSKPDSGAQMMLIMGTPEQLSRVIRESMP